MSIISKKVFKYVRKYPKVERKYGEILGIKVSITNRDEVLDFVRTRLESKEKFFIVTPNPENLLLATKDWLLEKSIRRAHLSIPDGIGLAMAHKFLSFKDNRKDILRLPRLFLQGLYVGSLAIVNKKLLTEGFEVIKGRELFLDIIKILNERKGRVYLFGGENGEQEKAIDKLKKEYTDITFKTNYKFPQFSKNGQPVSILDKKIHKSILGSIKLFEPDMVFVAMNTPKQEKWIFRNLYRLQKVTGAMTVGGTFNYVAGNMKLPPKWMQKIGLEWVYRLIQEPKRFRRILNAFPTFPWKVFVWKLKTSENRKLDFESKNKKY
jgi:N-acetylglucosaminyldiphosphoundecaprenol N-acetyl-beta-D-mannosaminyltransferase